MVIKMFIIGLALHCLSFQSETIAQESQTNPENLAQSPDSLGLNGSSNKNFIEIDKLIVDETISKAGYDFMELFLAQFTWPTSSNGSFLMVVAERPFRGLSTQIVITVNDLIVFESFLQTRYEFLEYLAEQATEQATSYLTNYESIILQLEGEDTIGNGIY